VLKASKAFKSVRRDYVLWLDQLNVFPVHYRRMRGLGDGVRFNAIAEATHEVAAKCMMRMYIII
jgi:hypothetical protein